MGQPVHPPVERREGEAVALEDQGEMPRPVPRVAGEEAPRCMALI